MEKLEKNIIKGKNEQESGKDYEESNVEEEEELGSEGGGAGCPICLQSLETTEEEIAFPPCSNTHLFHFHCILLWAQKVSLTVYLNSFHIFSALFLLM